MGKIDKIVKRLNFEPLNIFDNSKFEYELEDEIEYYGLDVTIDKMECDCTVVYSRESDSVCVMILTDLEGELEFEWLSKINNVNTINAGCGVVCYLDNEDGTVILKSTVITEVSKSNEDDVAYILNMSIASMPKVLRELA